MARTDPRVFARPFELHRGQALSERQLIDRLNDLGYAHRARAEQPGEFTVGREAMVLIPRDGDHKGRTVRLVFGGRPAKTAEPARIETIELPPDKKTVERITLDPPLITALVTSEAREKRRDVPLQAIPRQMIQAVLAIEDRRFYDHPGVDPIGIAGAVFRNIFGNKAYLASGSTVTQQLVKNTFLTPDKTPKRKMIEWFMSVVLETRLTKDQILQLYLNDVSLGQRGSFAIHGVAEAARLFFAKDISNVSVAEAATIAGVIQSPSRLSPFNNPERARDRRNVVIRAMADTGFISGESAERAVREPLQIVARALEAEAPYFVDYVSQELQAKYPSAGTVDVYTTLDVHLQRIAQDSLREGIIRLDEILARRKRQPQAALIAIDPRTGEVLAFVGGRSYNQSQYNRVVSARRQPGSVFKPFVYLAAFEHAQAEGRTDLTPATVILDEPTSFVFNAQTWSPRNYDGEYDGPITLRRALALSRNIAAAKVAESAGYEEVAALWRRVGAGTPPRPYPAIALGVFEATPFEIATAYTMFPNGKWFPCARALVGTESTCVLVLNAKLNLVHSPPYRKLVVIGYPDMATAGDHLIEILSHKPFALEGIDDWLVDAARKKGYFSENLALLPEGGGWLLVECGGESMKESEEHAESLKKGIASTGVSARTYDSLEQDQKVWRIRESALGLTAFVPGKPVTWEGWEDSAVPPEKVGSYLREFRKLLEQFQYDAALYGHLGDGCIHTRINFDLFTAEGIKKYRSFVESAADLVVSFGGSLSGEHGDGQSERNYFHKCLVRN